MTREEENIEQAIKELQGHKGIIVYPSERMDEVIDIVIKALEQEPFINKPCVSEKVCEHDKQIVLDKIRAEIERERSFQRAIDEYDVATGLRKALEILDKYKAESEEK